MMTTTLEDLKALRELLTPPDRFTTGAGARNSKGEAVGHSEADAVCFCLIGGMSRVTSGFAPQTYPHLNYYRYHSMETVLLQNLSDRLTELPRPQELMHFSDREGHSAVLALIDRALAEVAA